MPTGNFGDILAGYYAKRMGLPVKDLLVATNENDILHRFFTRGEYHKTANLETLAPSMDICVSSNFERLIFDLMDRDGAAVDAAMRAFRADGVLPDAAALCDGARGLFEGQRVDDAETLDVIRDVHAQTGVLLDPHTAVGVGAARKTPRDGLKRVVLATAHPAKFPDAVEQATGLRPALPMHLSDLLTHPEEATAIDNEFDAVRDFVRAHAVAAW